MRSKKLEAVILEDDMVSRLLLEFYCSNHPNIELKAAFDDIEEAIAWLGENNADIIFLDIQLKTSSGFDLVRHLPASVSVVVTSGHANNMEIAKLMNIPDFLQKPITLESFQKVVEGVKQRKTAL